MQEMNMKGRERWSIPEKIKKQQQPWVLHNGGRDSRGLGLEDQEEPWRVGEVCESESESESQSESEKRRGIYGWMGSGGLMSGLTLGILY